LPPRQPDRHAPLLTENHTHVILTQAASNREHPRPRKTPAT
jgi:hypothetical protein